MARPHGHHVVMKGGFKSWNEQARRAVVEAQAILSRHGIDVRTDPANLTWAENAGHSQEYAFRVRDRLKQVVDDAAARGYSIEETREAMLAELRLMGRQITRGEFK